MKLKIARKLQILNYGILFANWLNLLMNIEALVNLKKSIHSFFQKYHFDMSKITFTLDLNFNYIYQETPL